MKEEQGGYAKQNQLKLDVPEYQAMDRIEIKDLEHVAVKRENSEQ